jgi:hypothetical protein
MLRMASIVLALALVTTGCASVIAENPQQRVFAAQSDYNGVLALAVAYESQPRCTEVVRVACSEPAAVREIRRADTTAFGLLKAAQDTVRDPSSSASKRDLAINAAVNAIGAMRAILRSYGVTRA